MGVFPLRLQSWGCKFRCPSTCDSFLANNIECARQMRSFSLPPGSISSSLGAPVVSGLSAITSDTVCGCRAKPSLLSITLSGVIDGWGTDGAMGQCWQKVWLLGYRAPSKLPSNREDHSQVNSKTRRRLPTPPDKYNKIPRIVTSAKHKADFVVSRTSPQVAWAVWGGVSCDVVSRNAHPTIDPNTQSTTTLFLINR